MCWWLVALLITNAFGHDKIHNCIHDEIAHKVSQQPVKYKNHPLELAVTDRNKRKLLQTTAHQPIRIRPYYDPLLINSYTLSADQITYIKSLVSTSIHYLEQFVNVIPIHGPLFINRCQRVFHGNDDAFTYGACPLSDYIGPLKCQYATIPDAHIAESWYYDPFTLKSELYREAGSGIADADLVIYVSYSGGKCAGDGSTLAWASICTLDQFGRPISGTINFCPGALDTKYWKFDVGVTLHEIMHILAMSNTLFPYFYNWSSNAFYDEQNVIIESSASALDNTYIVTEKVKRISQTHFGCDTLIGAPLENTGAEGTIGSHWESKYLQSELMCGTMYSAVLYLSDFTLALMEDTGWYAMDYQYSDAFTWGYHEGCAFFNADCISKSTADTNFDQYWCTSATDNGCSYDYSTSGQCVNQLSGELPVQFKYYSDAGFGGPQSHDYCAFRYASTNPMYPDYEHICWDVRGNMYSKTAQYPTASFGINSRCVETTDGTNKNGYCFKHQCIEYDVTNTRYNAVQMIISDGSVIDREVIMCSRAQSLQWVESSLYSVYIKCPNIDSICGTTHKPFACYWGHYSAALQQCICSVGYIGSDCSIQDMARLAIEAAVATAMDVVSTILPQSETGLCITDSIKSVINGYYAFDGEYEGVASYQKENIDALYLYYLRYYAQWNVANSKGDLSIYAYCADSIALNQFINIENCKSWTVWDDNNGWMHDVGLHLFHCTPTYAPTPAPTAIPTIKPTVVPTLPSGAPSNAPTVSPSFTPTVFPTPDPTDLPTDFPTYDPTPEPTQSPTKVPSSAPTLSPTFQSDVPSEIPTVAPTKRPTRSPTNRPTAPLSVIAIPTVSPTQKPTQHPTTKMPTQPNATENPTNVRTTSGPIVSPTDAPMVYPTDAPSREKGVVHSFDDTTLEIDSTQSLVDLDEVLRDMIDNNNQNNENESEGTNANFIVSAVGCLVVGFVFGFISNRCVQNKKTYCCNAWKYTGICICRRRGRSFSSISRPRKHRFVFNDSDNEYYGDQEHESDALQVPQHEKNVDISIISDVDFTKSVAL